MMNNHQIANMEILYQDDHLIAVNKPSGLLSVPGRLPENKDSVALRIQNIYPTAMTIHRLDMETSGIIIMALDKNTHRSMSRLFQDRDIYKEYSALITGHPIEDTGSITLPLRCDWPNRPRQMVDHEQGKAAHTDWKINKRLTAASKPNNTGAKDFAYSHISLYPITGRSHQLRVHMMEMGHPILGDPLYNSGKGLSSTPCLQLHACMLKFTHPVTNIPICIENREIFHLPFSL